MGHKHSKQTGKEDEFKQAVDFLLGTTLEQALPKGTGKMRYIAAGTSVGLALRTLNGTLPSGPEPPILSAPVISKQYGTDLGLFDVMDATQHLARYSVLLRQGKMEEAFNKEFFDCPVEKVAGIHPSDVVLPFGPKTSLFDVIQGMLKVGSHRVCMVEDPTDAKSPIAAILPQSQLMAVCSPYLSYFEDDPNIPLSATKFGTPGKVHSIVDTEPVLAAFELMQALKVSAVPVLTADGKLINSISAANIRLLTKENSSNLLLPISQFLTVMSLHQDNSCHPETSLSAVVATMRDKHLHRLWVVDQNHHLVNVITVGDIVRRFFDNASKERPTVSVGETVSHLAESAKTKLGLTKEPVDDALVHK